MWMESRRATLFLVGPHFFSRQTRNFKFINAKVMVICGYLTFGFKKTEVYSKHILRHIHIWVVLPRTGKMSKICHNFFLFGALLWPNGLIFWSFVNCSEEILTVGVWKYFCFGPGNFFGFLKNLCFCPKIEFFANLWRSRATKPSELDWI